MSAKIIKNLGLDYYLGGATPRDLAGEVSKSMLWAFNQSPFKWKYGPTFKPTKAMEWGTLVHSMLLTEDETDKLFAVSPYDDFRKTEAREWKEQQIADGKSVITQKDIDRAANCVSVIEEDQTFFSLGKKDYEVAVYNQIGDTKVRGMIDIVPESGPQLVDLKTTSSIESVSQLQGNIIRRGYHWQAALYLDLWNAASGENRDQFWFLFVEDTEPFETAWISLSDSLIEAGRVGYMNAILRWQKCVATKNWPKAIDGVIEVDLPAWAKQENQ